MILQTPDLGGKLLRINWFRCWGLLLVQLNLQVLLAAIRNDFVSLFSEVHVLCVLLCLLYLLSYTLHFRRKYERNVYIFAAFHTFALIVYFIKCVQYFSQKN